MELRQFVKESLSQIVLGVAEAQEEVKGTTNAEISPTGLYFSKPQGPPVVYKPGRGIVQHVEFDVAVTTTETDAAKGGVGVFIAEVVGIGVQGSTETETVAANRIKFLVPILFSSEPYNWEEQAKGP